MVGMIVSRAVSRCASDDLYNPEQLKLIHRKSSSFMEVKLIHGSQAPAQLNVSILALEVAQ